MVAHNTAAGQQKVRSRTFLAKNQYPAAECGLIARDRAIRHGEGPSAEVHPASPAIPRLFDRSVFCNAAAGQGEAAIIDEHPAAAVILRGNPHRILLYGPAGQGEGTAGAHVYPAAAANVGSARTSPHPVGQVAGDGAAGHGEAAIADIDAAALVRGAAGDIARLQGQGAALHQNGAAQGRLAAGDDAAFEGAAFPAAALLPQAVFIQIALRGGGLAVADGQAAAAVHGDVVPVQIQHFAVEAEGGGAGNCDVAAGRHMVRQIAVAGQAGCARRQCRPAAVAAVASPARRQYPYRQQGNQQGEHQPPA